MALPNLAGLSLHAAAPTGVTLRLPQEYEEHVDNLNGALDKIVEMFHNNEPVEKMQRALDKADNRFADYDEDRVDPVRDRLTGQFVNWKRIDQQFRDARERLDRVEAMIELRRYNQPTAIEERRRRQQEKDAALRQADPEAWAREVEMRKNAEAWRQRPTPLAEVFGGDSSYDDDPYNQRARSTSPSEAYRTWRKAKAKAEAEKAAEQQRQMFQEWERQRQEAQETRRKKEGMTEIRKKELEYQRKYDAVGKLDEYIENLKERLWTAINRDPAFARPDWNNELQAILDDSSLDYAKPDRIKQLQEAVIKLQGVKAGFYP